jgi:hypothetical protein
MLVDTSNGYWIERASKKAAHELHKAVISDKRCRFYDLSKIEPAKRTVKSPIIQFYSSVDNIGNYLPVLGIREMIGTNPDTWCVQDKKIDFEFINRNYKCVIIGGAGLLVKGKNNVFERFWTHFSEKCHLPTIIWGVGTDGVDGIRSSYREVVSKLSERCDLVNVRDELTANTFNLVDPDISACPTLVHLKKIKDGSAIPKKNPDKVTLVHYAAQTHTNSEVREIHQTLSHNFSQYNRITNYQYSYMGLDEIIQDYYLKSSFVVTAMLHGAISAYSLGVPYVVISKTNKIEAFFSKFGNGLKISNPEELKEILRSGEITNKSLYPIAIDPVLEFGSKAKAWISAVC